MKYPLYKGQEVIFKRGIKEIYSIISREIDDYILVDSENLSYRSMVLIITSKGNYKYIDNKKSSKWLSCKKIYEIIPFDMYDI